MTVAVPAAVAAPHGPHHHHRKGDDGLYLAGGIVRLVNTLFAPPRPVVIAQEVVPQPQVIVTQEVIPAAPIKPIVIHHAPPPPRVRPVPPPPPIRLHHAPVPRRHHAPHRVPQRGPHGHRGHHR